MPRGRKKKEEAVLDYQILEDVWAQCDECQKWRRLPPGTVLDEKQQWFCKLNPDKKYNSCSLPEEDWQNSGDKEISAALGAELKAEAAKMALKKAAGHDLSAGTGSGRGRKRQTDNDVSWGFAPKKIKAQDLETSTVGPTGVLAAAAVTNHAPAAMPAPQAAPENAVAVVTATGNMNFPSLHDELKALLNGCSRILNNGGTWEPTKPNGHMSQDHINIPQWFWIGMQHLVPQAAALAASAVEVLTALQYSASGPQLSSSAANSIQQAELYVRLSLMSAASMVQPVVKLAMQGGDLAAAIAAATKPALPQPAHLSPAAMPAPAAASSPTTAMLNQTPGPATAGSHFTTPNPTPVPAPAPADAASMAMQASCQAGRPLDPSQPATAIVAPTPTPNPKPAPATISPPGATSPPAALPPPPPVAAADPAINSSASQSPTYGPLVAIANGPGAVAAAVPAAGVGGGSSQRPGGSAAGSQSRASSPGTTSTAPTDTGPGSSGRGDSREQRDPRESFEPREPREPRPPRERQRDPAYERHLHGPQATQQPHPAPPLNPGGRSSNERERSLDRDRERDRRDGVIPREREYRREYSRERDGPPYAAQPHSHHSNYREPRERERITGPESPRQAPYHGYGADAGGSTGRDWHDGRSERRDSRERERSYERQGPPPQYGYSGGSGSMGRDHREGSYGHHIAGYREREFYGHQEGPSRGGDREGYYRGGSGGPRYGGYPPEAHRGERDRSRGGTGGPQDWSGREREWDSAYDGTGGYYDGGSAPGTYGRSSGGPPPLHRGPPPPPAYGNDPYGPPGLYSQHGYSQQGHHSQAGGSGHLSSPSRDRVPPRGPYQHSPQHPPHRPGGGPPPSPAATLPAAPALGQRPVPLPPSLAALPPETVAKLLQEQGHTVKSVHVINPTQPPLSLPPTAGPVGRPGSAPAPSPYASGHLTQGTGSGVGQVQPMTIAQIRAAAAAAAAQKQQQLQGVGSSQGYVHGSGGRGISGYGDKR